MKTIEQHNAERKALWDAAQVKVEHTDIACPTCGAELVKTGLTRRTGVLQPEVEVKCSGAKCTYSAFILE